MPSTINGQTTKPMPASTARGIAKGEPKRLAQTNGPKPTSTVRV